MTCPPFVKRRAREHAEQVIERSVQAFSGC
jgi:hypothetical protein